MVKIYSDKTNKFYTSVEEATKAEFELKEKENLERIRKEREAAEEKARKDKLIAERKNRAEEVENARKALIEAQKNYQKVLEKFIKDFGSYHYTETNVDNIPTLFDLFKLF